MGQIIAFNDPIELILEHNDNVVETVDDGWGGTIDVFLIDKIYWTEVRGYTWLVIVTHPGTGKEIEQRIEPHEVGSKNLPTPARFNSYPLEIHCSLRRV